MIKIVSIQYLRAIAAILVVIFHYANTFREKYIPDYFYFDIGAYGVDVFFVISGFIMYSISAARSPTPIGFMKDRIKRIVPLYWVLTIIAAFVSTSHGIVIGLDVELSTLLKSLFFFPEWHFKYTHLVAPVLLVGWTLNLEMVFYAIFAVSLLFHRRIGTTFLLLILLVMGTAQFWFVPAVQAAHGPDPSAVVDLYTRSIILEFGAGILIGMLYERPTPRRWISIRPRHALVVAACLAVGSVVWLFFSDGMPNIRALRFGVPATMLVAAALLAEPVLAARRFRLLEFLGDASYSIYLAHLMAMPVVYLLIGAELAHIAPALALAGQIACAVAIGALVYLALERPLAQIVKMPQSFKRRSTIP